MNRAVNLYLDAATRRNDVLGGGIVDLARATTRSIERLRRSVQTVRRKRAWIGKLNSLNDHLLRDIGLARQEIPGHVSRHIGDHAVPAKCPALVQRAGQAARAAQRRLQAWQDTRITARQLRCLDPGQLADIGLRPSDIHWLARDLALRSLATPDVANDNRDRRAA